MKPIENSPKLYRELATWWPLLSSPEDYAEEAAFYTQIYLSEGMTPRRTLLELGSGGGNNASHMKKNFTLTLVDRSPEMLYVSEALNPECEHIKGDMRSIHLNRYFDLVFVHDAIMYMTTEQDLRLVFQTTYEHCKPGGVALFVPDHTRENFRPSTDHGGHDNGMQGLRYVEWNWDPDPTDNVYITDFAYLLRDLDGKVHCEYDRHLLGLFSRDQWLEWIAGAGFHAKALPFDISEFQADEHEVFVGVKSRIP